MWTYHTRFTWITLAAGATPCRVQDSHTGVQGIERFGASIPSRRLQLGQRRHSPTTFSRLCHLYCTEDKDTAQWQIIRRRRPTSLEQFAGCTAGRRGLRTVQSVTKDTFVWLIETAAPSDFLLLLLIRFIIIIIITFCPPSALRPRSSWRNSDQMAHSTENYQAS